MSLTPEQLQALKVVANNKAIKESRDSVSPGSYPVDFTVHISGTLSVAGDGEVAPSVKLDDKAIIALLITRLRDKGVELTVSDCVEALGSFDAAAKKKLVAATDYADTLASEKARVLREKGKTSRRGAVGGKISFDVTAAAESGGEDEFNPVDLLS